MQGAYRQANVVEYASLLDWEGLHGAVAQVIRGLEKKCAVRGAMHATGGGASVPMHRHLSRGAADVKGYRPAQMPSAFSVA